MLYCAVSSLTLKISDYFVSDTFFSEIQVVRKFFSGCGGGGGGNVKCVRKSADSLIYISLRT